MVRAVLSQASLVELKEVRAVIACPVRYAPGARQRLAEIAGVFEKELGRKVEVVIEEQNGASDAGAASSNAGAGPGEASPHAPEAATAAAPTTANPIDDPLVKTAVELFSARIVSVSRRPQ